MQLMNAQYSDGFKNFEQEIITVRESSFYNAYNLVARASEKVYGFKWPKLPAGTNRHKPLTFRLIFVSTTNNALNLGTDEGIDFPEHRRNIWTRLRQQASALQISP